MKTRLLAGFLLVVLVALIIGLSGIFYLNKVTDSMQMIVNQRVPQLEMSLRLKARARGMTMNMLETVLVREDVKNLDLYEGRYHEREKLFSEILNALLKGDEELRIGPARKGGKIEEYCRAAEKALIGFKRASEDILKAKRGSLARMAQKLAEVDKSSPDYDSIKLEIMGTEILSDEMKDLVRNTLRSKRKVLEDAVEDISERAELQMLDATKASADLENAAQIMLMAIIACGIVVATVLAIWLTRFVLRQVGGEPAVIGEITERIAKGELDIEFEGDAKATTGILASVMTMVGSLRPKDEMQREAWLKTGLARLNDTMSGDLDITELSGKVISEVTTYLDAQVGAFYVLDRERGTGNAEGREVDQASDFRAPISAILTLTGSYAYTKRKNLSNKFRLGEGLAGQAALEQQRILVRNVPEDYMQITSTLVEGVPRFVCVSPFLSEGRVKGVIEVGALHEITDQQLDYLDQTLAAIAVNVQVVQSRARVAAALTESQALSEELQAQQEELTSANEELEEQAQMLKESEENLQAQQEELQVTNEELEEKTEHLEGQKREVEQTNAELVVTRQEIEEKAEELALASKYKSEFLSSMSHELRTPLNSLFLLAQMLAENKEGNLSDDQLESARVIHSSGGDLLNLINEILDLSKIEAGRIDLRVGAVSISELAEETRTAFHHLAEEKSLSLEVNVAAEAPGELVTDRKRVGQVIKNLVSNAIKFTESGGVTVTFGRPSADANLSRSGLSPSQSLAIEVKDTGIGIAPEKHKVIFEAFQQAEGGTSRKYGGTGLGLSISRELVLRLGGEIRLEGEAGKGSTFTVYLPIESKAQEGMVTERPERKPDPGTAPLPPATSPSVADDRDCIVKGDTVILVVEDDPAFAKLLIGQCRDRGFKGLVAASGEEGLRLADEHPLSAVILDIRLPVMDGWSVLNQLKAKVGTRHIPVHIISVEEPSQDALSRGAIGFLQKPVSPDDLRDAFGRIEDVLDKRMKDLLVVVDDEKLREAIVKMVGNGDVHLDETATGKGAIEKLKSKKYDCMILDLNLPDMSGFELLEKVEEMEDIILPPVVVHTGMDLTREEEVSLRSHTESIVVKGVRSEERLFDEVSLFLHRVVEKMPEKKRRMITNLHDVDSMFKGKKVLVVDDDMRNLFALSKALASRGITTMKAESGRKALDALEAEPDVDLLLMDIMMPVMDGYETMKRIRAQKRFDRLPIIALTAKAMKQDRQKCIDAGANDYLPKPVDVARLLSMMRVWMYR